jgi:bacterioferritin-associated ferredoxin
MLICHCHVVYDDQIQAHIEDGARSPEEVGRMCGAGTSCGGCHAAMEDLLDRMDSAVQHALEPA